MKFLTLLLLCCVAKDLNSATVPVVSMTIQKYLDTAQKQINSSVDAQKKAAAAAGVTSNVKAPTVPTPANPNQIIINPPKIPLPNPKCDFKGLSALLKAMFGRVKGSCSNVKKSRGPLKKQCEDAKANFNSEFTKPLLNATEQVSYEFPNCSNVVDTKIKGFASSCGKVFDALSSASSGQEDTKKCGKKIDVSVKELTISLKTLLESMNSITGSAKPIAGTNAADAVATSDLVLSTILQTLKSLLDMVTSVSSESSVEIGGITKTLSDAVEAINKKVEGGSKIVGSVCVEFSFSLTVTIKMVSSVDMDALTEECGKIETDLGEATDSASDIEEVDDDEDDEEETDTSSGDTSSAPSGDTSSAPSGDTSSAPSGDTSTAPSGDTSSAPSGETTSAPAEEKPTATDVCTKISSTINVSFTSITKTCGALKTDVPALGDGKVDASLSSVSTSLTAILTIVQKSETLSVTELSTQLDAAIIAFVKSSATFFTTVTTVKESLSSDTSVAGTTAVEALELIQKTILSISLKVILTLKVLIEKLNLFTTVTLDAIFETIGKIDVKTADSKTVATDLTAVTSPTELNPDSCKKVIEGLGKTTTEAVGKIKTKFSARFELRISFMFKAFGYTCQKVKAPKVTDGFTKIQGSFSVLIKEIQQACSCAKESKAKGGEGGSSGSSEEDSSEEGSGEKSKCKPLSPNSFKSVIEALLAILDASKTAAADTKLDPKVLEILKLIVKTLVTNIKEIFTGLSASLTEQTIDASVLLSLGTEILTKATGEADINLETLTPTVDDLLCYGNAVDAATPAVDKCKKIETKISKPPTAEGEVKDTKGELTKLSTSASDAFTVLTKSVTTFTKYYSKPVDGVGKAITKIASIITKFIKSVTTTTDVTAVLEEFLVQISLTIVELSTAYTECSANTKTELDPKGYNAKSALKIIFKSTTTIINSIFISFKVYIVDIPADLTEFCTGVSDAVKADATSPDAEPKELGDKVKSSCDKHKASKGESGSGSNEDESGGD